MSVPSKPNLYNLLSQNCATEIEAILESNEYTRNEKIEIILTKRAHPSTGGHLHFVTICVSKAVPLSFSIKVLRFLGAPHLSRPICIECLKELFSDMEKENSQARPVEDKACLLAVVAEELQASEFNEVKSSLLVAAIMNDVEPLMVYALLEYGYEEKETIFIKHRIAISYSQSYFRTDQIRLLDHRSEDKSTCSLVYDATILEIAMHKRANYEVIKKLVEVGGKELLSLSTRSLLHLAVVEYGGNVVTSIVKLFLEVGGRDLLMREEHWYPIHQNGGLFQFLSSDKHRFHLPDEEILNIMNLCIDVGGRDFVLNKTKIGQTILHEFRFFHDEQFIPLVGRILDYGGMDLFKVKSQGGTILHCLARARQIHSSYWDIFQFNKEIVMIDDESRTALHEACANIFHGQFDHNITATRKLEFILLLLRYGGKELAWSKDKPDGNTPLHLLPFKNLCDGENFKIAEMIIRTAGKNIIRCCNNKDKEPFTPFINHAIEFQMNEQGNLSTMKDLEERFASEKKIWNEEKQSLEEKLKAEENHGHLEVESIKELYNESLEIIENYKGYNKRLEAEKQSLQKVIENQRHGNSFDNENEQHEAEHNIESEESESRIFDHTSSEMDQETIERLEALLASKERENEALKHHVQSLENDTSNSSRDEQEVVDNANHSFITPTKRSRTDSKDDLEIEMEDLMNQLEQEKSNHMRTMQRLRELRKTLRQKKEHASKLH
ncbi:predicted protein [Chaetoceros tenuissimus]|uniref:Ankyrin repeat-containing protein n=1 Tax=Chaetoceros tenuissimus TaxID=426638 RepID=A0AAD3CF18_9STRA|nr:predicted protein [Chaetoceros tenuissimus]